MASHKVLFDVHRAEEALDKGNATTITCDRSPMYMGLIATGTQTRTLSRPTNVGDIITIAVRSTSGTITLTVTGNYNTNGDSTIAFTAAGQFAMFISSYDGTNYYWRKFADHNDSQLLTSAGAAFTGRVTTTDGVASGTARVVGGLAYSNTVASTALTGNVNTEQLFDTAYTIPANTLKAGTVVKVRAQGIATTTQANDAVAYKLYIGGSGGTALISIGSTDATNADTFQAECTLICRTAGTTGTFVSTGTYKVSSAQGTMTVKDQITASTTINTQLNQALVLTATWNVANATNSCRVDILTVEIY